MLKKTVVLWCWFGLTPLTAQIYECLDEKGQRLWTNQTCQNAKVLHDGVSREEQLQAERSDKTQRAQRAKQNEAAAARFRENAYDRPTRATSRSSRKNLERCETSRRSLRIELSKTQPDRERARQLRSDERQYC